MSMETRIYYDDEAHNWHFHVPDLHIVGGGQRTYDEASAAAAEAIAFTLESLPDAGSGERPER
jgi:predicted RNase H-like HicB family nuclease